MNDKQIKDLMIELKEQTLEQMGMRRLMLDMLLSIKRIEAKLEVKE